MTAYQSERLQRSLDLLKGEFYAAGKDFEKDKTNSNLIGELNALTGAINAIEVYLYDKRITVVTDCVR